MSKSENLTQRPQKKKNYLQGQPHKPPSRWVEVGCCKDRMVWNGMGQESKDTNVVAVLVFGCRRRLLCASCRHSFCSPVH